jgi:hypothetical protein
MEDMMREYRRMGEGDGEAPPLEDIIEHNQEASMLDVRLIDLD